MLLPEIYIHSSALWYLRLAIERARAVTVINYAVLYKDLAVAFLSLSLSLSAYEQRAASIHKARKAAAAVLKLCSLSRIYSKKMIRGKAKSLVTSFSGLRSCCCLRVRYNGLYSSRGISLGKESRARRRVNKMEGAR